jgi:hypothetical protein
MECRLRAPPGARATHRTLLAHMILSPGRLSVRNLRVRIDFSAAAAAEPLRVSSHRHHELPFTCPRWMTPLDDPRGWFAGGIAWHVGAANTDKARLQMPQEHPGQFRNQHIFGRLLGRRGLQLVLGVVAAAVLLKPPELRTGCRRCGGRWPHRRSPSPEDRWR